MSEEQRQTQPTGTTAVATRREASTQFGQRGVELKTFDDVWRFAVVVSKSGMAPKGVLTAEACFVAIQLGMEVGIPPMTAIQNTSVINNRPAIYGDIVLGLVYSTGSLEDFDEWYEVAGKRIDRNPSAFSDDVAAVCFTKRAGKRPVTTAFSVADAKRAGLWGKEGPWTTSPSRMLRFRARSFTLRDSFPDTLKGIKTPEEVEDMVTLDKASVKVEDVPAASRGFVGAPTETATPPPVQVATPEPVFTAAKPNPKSAEVLNTKPVEVQPVALASAASESVVASPIETPIQKLQRVLTEANLTFDDLKSLALRSQFFKAEPEQWREWGSILPDQAMKMAAISRAIVRDIQKHKAGAGGAQ